MALRWPPRLPKRAVILQPYAIPVEVLRILWVALVSWFESGTFKYHVKFCPWPESGSQSAASDDIMHVLVIADPQVLDSNSYPGRNPLLMWLSKIMVDLNMRKSWSAALSLKPHAAVFLGDMMDNGRSAMYERYYERFKHLFRTSDKLTTYYLPGNHDVGLGSVVEFSANKIDRYQEHFGPLNQEVTLGDHPAVLIDAPGLVEEDRERSLAGVHHVQWAKAHPHGPIAFVQAIRDRNPQVQPILFTHIPLSRPDDASCGSLREKGTIRRGSGFGYQNTLSPEISIFLLRSINPSLILSGDDHDYCEYNHIMPDDSRPHAPTVREVTVRSLSMAMGVRHPGFQLLTLAPHSAPADAPCVLPDQLGIYLHVYVPLALFSLFVLAVAHAHRVSHRTRAWTLWDRREDRSEPDWYDVGAEHSEDEEKPLAARDAPPPDATDAQAVRWEMSVAGIGALLRAGKDRYQRAYYEVNAWRARAGFVRGFVKDVGGLAVIPLIVFVLTNWSVW